MKIIFFVPRIENCGPVNVVLNIVKELCSYPNISITIISLRRQNNGSAEDYSLKFKEANVEDIIYLDQYSMPFKNLLDLNKIVRNADVIHSHGFFPDFYTSLITKKILKISTAHCIFLRDYQSTYGRFKGSTFAFLHHMVYLNPSFNNLIGCSENVEKYLLKTNIFNRNKISTIQNGVNHNSFFKLNNKIKLNNRQKLLTELEIPQHTCSNILIYSGGLTRRKRVPELIDWFLDLPSNDNILLILGDGEEREKCEKATKNANNIFFLGFVNETSPWYQIGDYIVSNSSLEGFPMSILEGMSCGCKALLSDIPAHKEVIKYFPSLAMPLSKDFSGFNDVKTSEIELSHLSSSRMAKQYLSIYNK